MGRAAFALAAAMAAVLALGVACGGGDGDESTTAATGEREITVVATDQLKFEPAEITVKAGEPVRLTFDNSRAQALHDFTVEGVAVMGSTSEGADHDMHGGGSGDADAGSKGEFAVHVAAEGGHRGMAMFTPMEPGEYEFYCTVPGHREAGMKGTLIVR